MCDLESLEKLQRALLEFQKSTRNYADLSPLERTIQDLSFALYARLDQFKSEGAGHHEPAQGKDLGALFQVLGSLADSGALSQVLNPRNESHLRELLGDLKSVGLAEAALRKKDAALYLKHSGDTDLLVDEQNKLRDAASKKDR